MKTYLITLFLFAIGCFLSPCHAQSKMYDIYDMDDVLDSLKKNGFEVFIDSRVEITPESGEVYYTEYDESRPDMFYINDI